MRQNLNFLAYIVRFLMLRPQPTYIFFLELLPFSRVNSWSFLEHAVQFLVPASFDWNSCPCLSMLNAPLHSLGLKQTFLLFLWALLPMGFAHTSPIASVVWLCHGFQVWLHTARGQELLKGSVMSLLQLSTSMPYLLPHLQQTGIQQVVAGE